MKKFIIMMVAILSFATTMSAQTAFESPKLFDNTFISVGGGVATPLSFDAVFPLNPTATLAVGKQFTPVWGAEVEGTAWFGSHAHGGTDSRFDRLTHFDRTTHNVVRGSFVGVNGLTNLTNLFLGYKGSPRLFEVSTVLGGGWLHVFTPNNSDKAHNGFGVKTGLDLAFNLGEAKAHTIKISPSVIWDVTSLDVTDVTRSINDETMPLKFDKRFAQLQLGVSYTYHFATSNGTHHFRTYDVGAMNAEINRLIAENDALRNRPTTEVTKTVVETKVTKVLVPNQFTVQFAFDDATLSESAKAELSKIEGGTAVTIDAFASPEGKAEHNQKLSEARANSVKLFLEENGVRVLDAHGHGVTSDTSNRIAIVTIQ